MTNASRLTVMYLRYAPCSMLYALCWYVKGEGDEAKGKDL